MRMRSMLYIVSLALGPGLLVTTVSAQGHLTATQGEVGYQMPAQGGRIRWTFDLMVGCDFCDSPNPIVWTTDSHGYEESISVSIPDANRISIRDVASGPDKSLAAVGLAIAGNSRGGNFILWISPDRSKQTVIRVWPYTPNVVAVAPDGTIWAVGGVGNSNFRRIYDNVLRHYSPSGQLLSSTILQNIRPEPNGFPEVSQMSELMASNDRIGWLTGPCQYVEFSFDGMELGSYSCPSGFGKMMELAGAALSPTDDLLVGSRWLSPLAPLQLNRSSNAWTPVTVSQDSGKTWMIVGFDGNTLVTATPSSTMRRYSWSAQAAGGQ